MSPPTGGVNGPEAKVVLPYCWHLLRILTPYPLCWPHQILHMHDPAMTEGRHDPKTVGEGVLCTYTGSHAAVAQMCILNILEHH